jgi:hypothetical protein
MSAIAYEENFSGTYWQWPSLTAPITRWSHQPKMTVKYLTSFGSILSFLSFITQQTSYYCYYFV